MEADKKQPKKNYYLSYLVMELLGPRVGCMSLDMQAYRHNKPLLVNHGLCMLTVSVVPRLSAVLGWVILTCRNALEIACTALQQSYTLLSHCAAYVNQC